jgi:hypothetical protein
LSREVTLVRSRKNAKEPAEEEVEEEDPEILDTDAILAQAADDSDTDNECEGEGERDQDDHHDEGEQRSAQSPCCPRSPAPMSPGCQRPDRASGSSPTTPQPGPFLSPLSPATPQASLAQSTRKRHHPSTRHMTSSESDDSDTDSPPQPEVVKASKKQKLQAIGIRGSGRRRGRG